MEMSLIEIKGKTFTRFKINKTDWNRGFMKPAFKGKAPSKESSRFIYFEIEGDLINKNKEE